MQERKPEPPPIQYPTTTQLDDLENATGLSIKLCKELPRSREASIAITKLEEATLWLERLRTLAG